MTRAPQFDLSAFRGSLKTLIELHVEDIPGFFANQEDVDGLAAICQEARRIYLESAIGARGASARSYILRATKNKPYGMDIYNAPSHYISIGRMTGRGTIEELLVDGLPEKT